MFRSTVYIILYKALLNLSTGDRADVDGLGKGQFRSLAYISD